MTANNRRWPLTASLVLALSAAAAVSAAQAPPAAPPEAQALFDDALALMKAGNYAEACPKLARSQELDPGMGTQFRLAQCYEGLGRLATAWRLYVDVAAEAKKAGRADREEQARERVDELRPRLPTLTLAVGAAVAATPGLQVTRDGERVDKLDWNQKMPVDPGDHVIAVTAPGKKPFQQTVKAVEKASLEVSVPALEEEGAAPAKTTAPTAGPAPTPSAAASAAPAEGGGGGLGGQKIAAIAIGVAGLAGIGVGAAMGFTAKSQWDEALTRCANGEKTRCDGEGIQLGKDASTSATVSTIGFAAGGVLAAGAVVLWLLAPKKAQQKGFLLAPAVGRQSGGAVFQGRF